MRRLVLIFITLGTISGRGDDITLRDGTVYHDATIISHTDASAEILYKDGGVSVPLSLLPENLQEVVGYDPAKETASQVQAQGDKDYARALQKFVMIDGNLVSRERITAFVLTFKVIAAGDAVGQTGRPVGHGCYVEIYDPNYVPPVVDPPPVAPTVPEVTTNTYTAADGTLTNEIVTAPLPPPPPPPPPPGPHDTGRKAFLVNYTAAPYGITTARVVREGFTKEGVPYYLMVADTFSLEDWQNAGSPK